MTTEACSHLTSLVWVCVLWLPESLTDLSALCCEIALMLMSLDFTDDQSTLVQIMACCLTAPSHYLSQCWPRSLLLYGITRPEWVLKMKPKHQKLKIAYWNRKWICWEKIIMFSTMPPNAVTSPLLTLLYIEEMADHAGIGDVLSGTLNGGLGWWMI